MIERRRGPRAPISVPIVEEEYFLTTCGITLNVSEFGLRYFKLAPKKENPQIAERYNIKTNIRSINFSIPKKQESMRLVCSVIDEKIVEEFIETSCEFICLTNEQRHAILNYVDNS